MCRVLRRARAADMLNITTDFFLPFVARGLGRKIVLRQGQNENATHTGNETDNCSQGMGCGGGCKNKKNREG